MNGVMRALLAVPFGYIKYALTKIRMPLSFSGGCLPRMDFSTEFSIDNGAKVTIGKKLNLRTGSAIRVRSGAKLKLGDNVSFNNGCILTCRGNISIGNGCQISPYVSFYDHDHDFRSPGGISDMNFKTGEIIIGNNVWIGTNVVILRGTVIGDNCVIAAGSVVKGTFESNMIIYNKIETATRPIMKKEILE